MDAMGNVFANYVSVVMVALEQTQDQELAEFTAALAQISVFVNIAGAFKETWRKWRTSVERMCQRPPDVAGGSTVDYQIQSVCSSRPTIGVNSLR
jgi:hypothetical protein